MTAVICPNCGGALSPAGALTAGTVSWPVMSAYWMVCSYCDIGSHILVKNEELVQIQMVSAPGPEWVEGNAVHAPGLSLRADPGFLHVWLNGAHYEFPARIQA